MENNYSPSINIVRDFDKTVDYTPTANSKDIFKQIVTCFPQGIHSFNIVGSYGTGKSAFLLALVRHLQRVKLSFSNSSTSLNGCEKYKVVRIVGRPESMLSVIGEELGVSSDASAILMYLKKEHGRLKKRNTCLVLIIDEFGKLLEYAAKNNPDEELYFVQQLAEYANDSRRNFLFLTTLHQNFDAYAIGLEERQRREWEKVKGRIKELAFNEPVEQLLSLASSYLKQKKYGKLPKDNIRLTNTIGATCAFNLLTKISEKFAKSIFPFDPLSAMVLTKALQRYGQNERSLFNFLQTDEFLGINDFAKLQKKNPYYNLSCVYNYLQYNFYSILSSKHNPDFFKWSLLKNSCDRVEMEFNKEVIDAQKIIHTIGLLDILGTNAAKINRKFLETYGRISLGIKSPKALINKLEAKKIIRYQSFKERFILFEGTDIDIDLLIKKSRKKVDSNIGFLNELEANFQQKFLPAKSITYKSGTPRVFEFVLSDDPINSFNSENNAIDGIINLVTSKRVKKASINNKNQPIIYGFFKKIDSILNLLLEIKILERAIHDVGQDKVAKRELQILKKHLHDDLTISVNEQLYDGTKMRWFYNSQEIKIDSKRSFNEQLSRIIEKVYSATPEYRNELMNKSKVSSSIHFAKKQYLDAMIEHWNTPNLGFSEKTMPPEKTIFYTLLRYTGLHGDITSTVSGFFPPTKKSSFYKLWKVSELFLSKCSKSKRNLSEFIHLLKKPPFGLKNGFIEFWIITFLFIKREDYALYKNGNYIPRYTKEVGELFFKDSVKYSIKSFNIKGVKLDLYNKYRALTRQQEDLGFSESGFQEMARPFLTFYKDLPRYSQLTTSISHDAIAFRKTISNAKELEKTFFEDLPACFGYTLNQLSKSSKVLGEFVNRIHICIHELRSAQETLLDRIENRICKVLGYKKASFSTNKKKIQKRYSTLKTHLLNSRQKTLVKRIQSQLPDKSAWINSFVQAILGKQLQDISDEEEIMLIDRIAIVFKELDDLLELSKVHYDEDTEDIFKIEITSIGEDVFRKNIILSKVQKRGAKTLEKKLRTILNSSKDKQLTQALLIKLLKESNTNG